MENKKTQFKKNGVRTSCSTGIPEDKLNEAIRQKAIEVYEKNGRQPGHDLENWLKAEKIVLGQICGETAGIERQAV